jgi:hypothetical protein
MRTKAIMKQKSDNPFDGIFFWFQLATTDFSFGSNEDRRGEGPEAEKGGPKTGDPNPDRRAMRSPGSAVQ